MGLFDFLGGGGGESGGGGVSMEDGGGIGGIDVAGLLGFGDSPGGGSAGGGGGGGGGGALTASGDVSTYQGVRGTMTVGYTTKSAGGGGAAYQANLQSGYPQTVSSILDQAENTIGQRVSARAIRYAAKKYGIFGAAQVFGLDPVDIGFLLAAGTTSRRGKGVTARQLKNVGRVLGVFASMQRRLHKYVNRAHLMPAHSRALPAHHSGKR